MSSVTVNKEEAALEASISAEDARKSLEFVKKVEVHNQSDLQWAVSAVAEIKTTAEAVELKRRSFTEPLKKVVKDLEEFFRPAEKSLKESEAVLKKAIVAFAERRSAERRALIERAATSSNATALIAEAEAHEIPKVQGMSLTRATHFTVLDRSEAVAWCVQNGRLDLLTLDEKTCKALTKAGTLPAIDGVRHGETFGVSITKDKVQR